MVRGLVTNPSKGVAAREVLESRNPEATRVCPHCAGIRIARWGKANGLSRRRCGDCKRTFNALTGTPLDEQVPVLVARDRQGHTHSAVLPDLTAAGIAGELLPVLGAEVVLCSDTAKAYAVTARRAGLRHEPVNIAAGERVRDDVFHIQNVNACDSRLKDWMRRFKGVATRHLPSDLGRHRLSERLAATTTPQSVLINCCA